MSREHLIQLLVIDSLEHANDMRRYLWLQQVLESGFRGFAKMSDAELEEEIHARRLDPDEDTAVEDADIDHADDDGDIGILLQGYMEYTRVDVM